jgi:hypothetical protein
MKNISPQHMLIGLGVILIGSAFAYTLMTGGVQDEPTGGEIVVNEQSSSADEVVAMDTTKPVVTSPMKPSTGTGSLKPSTATQPSVPSVPSSPVPTTPTAPTTTPAPTVDPVSTPIPSPYSPGFQANVRITPEIPSENERATLPACTDKLFTIQPVDLGLITSISATGTFTPSHPSEFARFIFSGTGELYKYDVTAPADVWITHIAQETGVTSDPEDTTIYFALCRDVIGYVTHVKEMSAGIYKLVTDSVCLGKPHVGEEACHIKVLELVGRGSVLGKVGRLEGSFGFGVIDLRTQTNFTSPSSYPIKTNFAVCPFSYFSSPSGFLTKLVGSSSLCPGS